MIETKLINQDQLESYFCCWAKRRGKGINYLTEK